MATKGLSFENPLYSPANGVPSAVQNPYGFENSAPAPTTGLQDIANMGALGVQLARQDRTPVPEPVSQPFYSPSKKQFYVQGVAFDADDAQSFLDTEGLLSGPAIPPPAGEDWVPIDPSNYAQLLNNVKNPSLGRLASKNFGIGVDNMQMLAGRGLQLAGAEDLGGRIVAQQQEDLRRTMPFQRQFTDVQSGGDAVEWFVANLAQQGPNLLESVAVAGTGFLAGTLAGGPLAGAGAAVSGLLGKQAFKQSVMAAAKKKAAGETLNAAETKLLREAAGLTGAITASYAQNLASGAADIYGELRDQGAGADDMDARLTALAGSIPYAALETVPEFLLASRLFGGTGASTRALKDIPTTRGKAGELLKRGGTGLGVGGTLEGLTEAGQESLLLGLSDQDLSSPEGVNRLVNAFAAGFGVGGPIGAAANLRGKGPANLLNPGQTTEPTVTPDTGPTLAPNAPAGTQGELFTAQEAPLNQFSPLPTEQYPEGRDDYLAMAGSQRDFIQEQQESDQIRQGIVPGIPGSQPGEQGVLNLFADTGLTAQELAARRALNVPTVPEAPVFAPTADPRQGALQFSGYPEDNTVQQPFGNQLANQLMAAMQQRQQQEAAAQRQAEFEQAQAQQEAQRQAQLDQLQIQGQAQRQLDMIEPEIRPTPAPINLRRGLAGAMSGQPQPQQLELFTPRQAPAISRSEMLRRGVPGGGLPAVTGTTPPTAAQRRAQLPLFTQSGEPSVAALKSVGTRGRATAEEQEPGSPAKPNTRGLKKQAGVVGVGIRAPEPPAPPKPAEAKAEKKVLKQAKQTETVKPAPKEVELKKAVAAPAAAPKPQPVSEVEPQSPTEAWEDMKPEGAVTFDKLPAEAQKFWERRVQNKQATMQDAQDLLDDYDQTELAPTSDREPTTAELADDAMRTAEEADTIAEFRDAVDVLVQHAFFLPDDTNNKAINEKVRDFLNATDFTEQQLAALDAAFVMNQPARLEATYKGGALKGQSKPWFRYAQNRDLMKQVTAKVTNYPEEYKTKLDAATTKVSTSAPAATSTTSVALPRTAMRAAGSQAFQRMSNLINDINGADGIRRVPSLTQKVKVYGTQYPSIKAALKDLRSQLTPAERDMMVRGVKLDEYFGADGEPKFVKSGGSYKLTDRDFSKEQLAAIEAAQREEAKALAAEARAQAELEAQVKRLEDSIYSNDWDESADGMYMRADGGVAQAIPQGRIKLLVKNLVAKYRIKPNVAVYANVEDLKTRNPSLYKQAAAARKNGDFDSVRAMGYSFGPNVIIFSDFIRSEQQLAFVLAHETLGHFGFKGVMARAEMEKLFNRLYDTAPGVKANADISMQVRGMSKMEAIEEYLADRAAVLDTSLLARVWAALKNALNKLGLTFKDDEARYFLGQARRYVRNGERSNVLTAGSVAKRMQQMNQEYDDGMYARDDIGDSLVERAGIAGTMNYKFGENAGILGAVDSWRRNVKQFGQGSSLNRRNLPGKVSELLANVSTLSNRARQSYGLSLIYRMMESQQRFGQRLLSKYSRITEYTHMPNLFGVGKGPTEQQKEIAGKLLAHAALYKSRNLSDDMLRTYAPMIKTNPDGSIDADNLAKVRQQLEDDGFVTAEEFRQGLRVEYDLGDGVTETKVFKYDVKEDSPEWRIYLETRQAENEAAIDLLLANYEAAQDETVRTLDGLNKTRKVESQFDQEDLDTIRKVSELYRNFQYDNASVNSAALNPTSQGIKNSEDLLVTFGRALFDDNALNDWLAGKGTASKYAGAEFDDVRKALPKLRSKIKKDSESFQIQKAIRNLFLFDLQSVNADYYTKRSILGSYVPFVRRGDQQVRLIAYDAQGRVVRLDESQRSILPYFQFESRAEAEDSAQQLGELFGNDRKWKLRDAMGEEVEVTLVAEVSKTREATGLTEVMNLNEFVYVLNQMDINLTPQERERIVTTLTEQNSRARKNLQRAGTEGWDKDIIRAVSEHLETTAHVAAKKLYRYRISDVLLQDENWRGSPARLAALKAAVDNATTDGERDRARRAYDEYAFQYRYMAGSSGKSTVEIDGKTVPTLGRGEDYRLAANELVQWYSETTNITDSTEDILSGEVGSRLKMITVLAQLGGSVASAVMNLMSLPANTIPYLANYNAKRAFGGGYGTANTLREIKQALMDVKNRDMEESAFLKAIVDNKTYAKYGMTEDEAKAMFTMTEEGVLQAAQFNALVGSARGKVFTNSAQGAIKLWMAMFSYTEQLNRRATALAAYRLEKERALGQGVDPEQAQRDAIEAARKAVTFSQGEYAMFNRPKAARGNLLQYVFMYKQYPIITIELLRNMPKEGQLMMLGFLLLVGGIKGLPFAEDIMDLVDTLMQMLGLKTPSVEKAIGEWVDSVAPGMTPYAMRGVIDAITGATVSSRAGMGDLIPLTGFFRAGANPLQELTDFAGPVVGAIGGLAGTAGGLARYGAEAIGLKDDVTTMTDIFRESPVAAMRAIGDAASYITTGAVTNSRGQLVAADAGVGTILARLTGFYPAVATQQNDIVRLSKYVSEYAKEVKASYTGAYVKARQSGDTERAAKVLQSVAQWNEDAKGTGLELPNFLASANRALREAQRPTVLRYVKAAPKNVRRETLEMLQIYGIAPEELN